MNPRHAVAGCLLASSCLLCGGAAAQVVTEYSIGITVPATPVGIAAGSDGNLWFTELSGNRIGQITPLGAITEFSSGIAPGASPRRITFGPDGNLWFTEEGIHAIGRITPLGVVTEFVGGIAPGFTAGALPAGITAGPDGNVWFTEGNLQQIARITPAGVVTEFSGMTGSASPEGIVLGSDGNLWFTEFVGSRIGRITPAGVITEFSIGITPGAQPEAITAGPDGNLWFTEPVINKIGQITTAGAITEFGGITFGANLAGIVTGADGNLWFGELSGNRIGRITPLGVVSEFSMGITAGASPAGITAGPDGNLWFTESGIISGTPKIGRITTGVVTAQRTFVASNGSDVNPCSLPSPCRSFGAAIIKTSPGGEVVALDTAGYGPVIITKPVSIIAPPGIYAGVTVMTGTGIVVDPLFGKVTLRGLTINGLGGAVGIDYQSGDALYVDNVVVTGFTTAGLKVLSAANGSVQIHDSLFRANTVGATFGTTGGTSAILSAVVDDSNFEGNNVGVRFTAFSAQGEIRRSTLSGGGVGAFVSPTIAGAVTRVDIIESTITHNSLTGVSTGGAVGTVNLSMTSSLVSGNGTGVVAAVGGNVLLTDTTVTRNTIGLNHIGGGTMVSGTLNRLYNNTSDGTFSATIPRQ